MGKEIILKKLNGFSGSDVYLIEDEDKVFVRKINNVDRNYERMSHLSLLGLNIPKILNKERNVLDIEYIPGLDIKSYLKKHQVDDISEFLCSTISILSENKLLEKDYSHVYLTKLSNVNFSHLPFQKYDLFEKLPKKFYQSNYYGDLTLENILYSKTGKFYLIDASTIEYDSYVFDIAKLRQDLKCKWFLRKESISLEVKLNEIEDTILKKFPEANNDYILIMMLLRVYVHTQEDSFEQQFILREIEKLWK